jgi:tetratricopeptide (TPR) repeat protein
MKRAWRDHSETERHVIFKLKPPRLTLWQAVLLPVISVLIFFLLLEGGLALFGVRPDLNTDDPFVGFSTNAPLYVPESDTQGAVQMVTARNKKPFFNLQSFPQHKAPDAYRVFTLGGSTTYGRPYNDTTSFAGWLRELLPLVDGSKKWEVINAGGISYASYRVAHLMEELVHYQPDLFIVYTGHNEFLEERTYGEIKELPAVIRSTVGLLSRTRTWTAMTKAIQGLGITPQTENADRDKLSGEVNAILDQSAGLDRYTRDDSLQEKIFKHYRISLERMAELARSVDAEIIFVTPASNLNDCSPFKSEHTEGLDPELRQRSEQLLSRAKVAIGQERNEDALALLNTAVSLDPRHAGLQYHRGEVLLALKRFKEAAEALRRARDEDVCPLRALTPMRQIVAQVAEEQGVRLVDYIDLLERYTQKNKGYSIPGKEVFFDHVHPTIAGHKMLAIELVRAMASEGILQPDNDWEEQSVAAAAAIIDARVDEVANGLALANLARVLFWAGKNDEATRLAKQARETTEASEQVLVSSTSILTSILIENGELDKALDLLYETLEELPGAIEIRIKLGQTLNDPSLHEMEKAAANLLLVFQQVPWHDDALTSFSLVMARRGRLGVAYDCVTEALRLNPKNGKAQLILAKIQTALKGKNVRPIPFQVELEIYPSRAPRKLVQMRRLSGGRLVPHGIEVEFYENGRLKSFKDLVEGKIHGRVKTWDEEGKAVEDGL